VNEVLIAVTGLGWMGRGARSIESTLDDILSAAQDEVWFVVYAVSPVAGRAFDKLENLLIHGVRVHMIINRLDTQPEETIHALMAMKDSYSHFHLYSFESKEQADLHAKVIVVDGKQALIGSANFSQRAWTYNHEMALLVKGPVAGQIAQVVQRLAQSVFCKPVGTLERKM